MVQDMAAGKADLTWVGTRVFDMTRPDAVIVDIKMPQHTLRKGSWLRNASGPSNRTSPSCSRS